MDYHSQDPDIDIPRLRLDQFVLDAVARVDRSRVAIHDGDTGRELRYGALTNHVRRLTGALVDAGIGPGDVVALHLHNGVEFPIALLAVSACGATSTAVSPEETQDELSTHLLTVGAAMLITDAELLPVSGPLAATLGLAPERFVVVESPRTDAELSPQPDQGSGSGQPPDSEQAPEPHPHAADPGPDQGGDPATTYPPWTPFALLLDHPPATVDVPIDVATHPACLPFSSGTTGVPKPVMLSHRALVANAVQFRAALGLRKTQRTLVFLPFSHVYALTTGLLTGLVRGDTIVTMRRFDVDVALRLLAEQRITLAYVVPPVATILGTHPDVDPEKLADLRVIVSGAAALNPTVAHSVCDRLDVEVLQGYGLTEMAPVTHVMRLGAGMPVESVGTALPGITFRVVDPDTGLDAQPPAPGMLSTRGELLVRGPNAMSGYLARPEATAEVLDADGWVRTGDLVTVDDRGCVRFVDRLKEVLKNRGLQVPPAELEALLREYPGVADAAVTGVVGEDESDERPFALVVRNVRAGPGPSEEGLLRYVADRTADYKHLVGVAFVDGLPRSDAGKIMRRQLSQLLPAGRVPSRASS